jgi:hypothetical protein
LIKNGNRRFTPEDSVELHETSRVRLVDELDREFDGPIGRRDTPPADIIVGSETIRKRPVEPGIRQ